MTAPEKWAVLDVFGAADERHVCCSCCDEFCPRSVSDVALDRPRGPAVLVLVGDYVSDRYVAVKADLVDLAGWDPGEIDLPAALQVPEGEQGAESEETFVPSVAARLLGLGCAIVQGSTKPQQLYLDGRHIGWVMPSNRWGVTLPEVRDLTEAVARLEGSTEGELADVLDGMSGATIDNLARLRRAMTEDVA